MEAPGPPPTNKSTRQHGQRRQRRAKTKSSWSPHFKNFVSSISYSGVKRGGLWLFEKASVKLKFEDIMSLATIFALFGDDIKLLSTDKSFDRGFFIGDMICVALFALEMLLLAWTRTSFTSFVPPRFDGYLLSPLFFLDAIVIVSLLVPVLLNTPIDVGTDTRAGVIIRIMRLYGRCVRLYRSYLDAHVRLNSNVGQIRRDSTPSETVTGRRNTVTVESDKQTYRSGQNSVPSVTYESTLPTSTTMTVFGQSNDNKQSKLGSQLTNAITVKVIALTLVMLVVLPLTFYMPSDRGAEHYTDWLHNTQMDQSQSYESKSAVLQQYLTDLEYQPALFDEPGNNFPTTYYLLQLQATPLVNGYVVDHQSFLNGLRSEAIIRTHRESYDSATNITYITSAVFNMNPLIRTLAIYNILLTILMYSILIGGVIIITGDVQRLVLSPIERMVSMVEVVSKHPLARRDIDYDDINEGVFETLLLESTVDKITSLLRVGFGEAGSGIISSNLNIAETNYSSVINPLIPGVRVYAIVGFCDIHHFEEVNQLLEKDILIFVNTVAEIVHSSVQHWGGQCNKNLGNAFVVVWRIGDEDTLLSQTTRGQVTGNEQQGRERGQTGLSRRARQSFTDAHTTPASDLDSIEDINRTQTVRKKRVGQALDLMRVPGLDELADRALIAYLKVIAEINRNKQLLQYRTEPRLTAGDTQQFKVRMGFGLHVGWAIEGAVGSLYKVDATYLSPHVNMASRLETSSRQYGVPLLLSQNLHDLLSSSVKSKCRKLDVVTVKGSEVPIGLYTYDALQEQVFPSNDHMLERYGYQKDSVSVFPPGLSQLRGPSRREASRDNTVVKGNFPSTHTSSGLRSLISGSFSAISSGAVKDQISSPRPIVRFPFTREDHQIQREPVTIPSDESGNDPESMAQFDNTPIIPTKVPSFRARRPSGASALRIPSIDQEGISEQEKISTSQISLVSFIPRMIFSPQNRASAMFTHEVEAEEEHLTPPSRSPPPGPRARLRSSGALLGTKGVEGNTPADIITNNANNEDDKIVNDLHSSSSHQFNSANEVESESMYEFSDAMDLEIVTATPSVSPSRSFKSRVIPQPPSSPTGSLKSRSNSSSSPVNWNRIGNESPQNSTPTSSGFISRAYSRLAISQDSQTLSDSTANDLSAKVELGNIQYTEVPRQSLTLSRVGGVVGSHSSYLTMFSSDDKEMNRAPSKQFLTPTAASRLRAFLPFPSDDSAGNSGNQNNTTAISKSWRRSSPAGRTIGSSDKGMKSSSYRLTSSFSLRYTSAPGSPERLPPMNNSSYSEPSSPEKTVKPALPTLRETVNYALSIFSHDVKAMKDEVDAALRTSVPSSPMNATILDPDGKDNNVSFFSTDDTLYVNKPPPASQPMTATKINKKSVMLDLDVSDSPAHSTPSNKVGKIGRRRQSHLEAKSPNKPSPESPVESGIRQGYRRTVSFDTNSTPPELPNSPIPRRPSNPLDIEERLEANLRPVRRGSSSSVKSLSNTRGKARLISVRFDPNNFAETRAASTKVLGSDLGSPLDSHPHPPTIDESSPNIYDEMGEDNNDDDDDDDDDTWVEEKIDREERRSSGGSEEEEEGYEYIESPEDPRFKIQQQIKNKEFSLRSRGRIVSLRLSSHIGETDSRRPFYTLTNQQSEEAVNDKKQPIEQSLSQKQRAGFSQDLHGSYPPGHSNPGHLSRQKSDRSIHDITSSRSSPSRRLDRSLFLTAQDEPADVFEQDSDLVALRAHVTETFLTTFAEGVSAYLAGDWTTARQRLETSDQLMREAAPALGGDGPSLTLLRFMGEHRWIAPASWKGFRPLTSK